MERIIVLVEDNEDDILLTQRAFKRNKISNRIVVCKDGEAALNYLLFQGADSGRQDHELPQLVLLDLKLPKLGGLEVLRALRENEATRLMPVVVLTSSREEMDIVESYRLGANSYIRKPVDFEKFAAAVKQLGLYWLVLNESL